MRIAGNYTFEATRDEVWAALNDPEVLARTLPGCQKLEQVADNEFESTLKIGLQAVKGVYSGRVRLEDVRSPVSYRIVVNGRGSNGFLTGSGVISLRDEGATTILDYGGEAQIGGTLASVGQRLIDGAAKTLINQSLKALAAQIVVRRGGAPAETPAPPAPLVEQRSIVVPPEEQLSEATVARGVIADFLQERPWFPWVVVAFLLGYILGRRHSA